MAQGETIGTSFLSLRVLLARGIGQFRALGRLPALARWLRHLFGWRRTLVIGRRNQEVVIGVIKGPVLDARCLAAMPIAASHPWPEGDDPETVTTILDELFQSCDRIVDRIVVVIAPELVLHRQIRLPEAALADLPAAVALEIDRLTPFPPEQVVFAAAPDWEQEARERMVTVTVAAAARKTVEPLVTALHRREIPVDTVMLDDLTMDGLDAQAQIRPRWRRRLPSWLAATAGVVLAALLLRWPVAKLQDEIAQARGRLAAIMPEARAAASIRQALQEREEAISWLARTRRLRPTALALLDETARLLPQDAFLLQWSLDGERVTLIGYGREAARLIAIFDQAELLTQPRFTSALTSDTRLGRERFSLELALRPPSLPEETAGDQAPRTDADSVEAARP